MTRAFVEDVIEEFRGSDLGHRSRNKRLLAMVERIAERPKHSFPKQMNPAELEGAYRFFHNVAVDPEAILKSHVGRTLERMSSDASLLVHDSSTISFKSDGYREGLEDSGKGSQKFLIHCSLAVAADGSRKPFGVLASSEHLPTKSRNGQLQKRWADHIVQAHGLGVAPQSVIHVMDREADDYELLDRLSQIAGRFVIRVQHNRKLDGQRLNSAIKDSPIFAEREVKLSPRRGKAGPKQRKVHPRREGRIAQLAISATPIELPRPTTARKSTADSLTLNLVRVWEPEPPADQAPVEWKLYTSEPIDTVEQVLQVVDWYRARWTIEEYFKALKTGCGIEKRQLEDFDALRVALAMLIPVAWRLLLLKSEARSRPEAPATELLTEAELRVLNSVTRIPIPEAPTIREVVWAIAALGGHLKHNGPPGWQTLASGYETLRYVALGWALRENAATAQVLPFNDQ